MNIARQPYGKIVRLKWPAIDQFEAKSLRTCAVKS
jgi:hypothetical protein